MYCTRAATQTRIEERRHKIALQKIDLKSALNQACASLTGPTQVVRNFGSECLGQFINSAESLKHVYVIMTIVSRLSAVLFGRLSTYPLLLIMKPTNFLIFATSVLFQASSTFAQIPGKWGTCEPPPLKGPCGIEHVCLFDDGSSFCCTSFQPCGSNNKCVLDSDVNEILCECEGDCPNGHDCTCVSIRARLLVH